MELFDEIRRTRALPEGCGLSEKEVEVLRQYESGLPALEAGPSERVAKTKGAEQSVKELSASLARVNEAVTRRDLRIKELEWQVAARQQDLEREAAARQQDLAAAREEVEVAKTGLAELAAIREQLRNTQARLADLETVREELSDARAGLEDQKIECATQAIKVERAEAAAANATRESIRKTLEITRLTRLLVSRERQLQERGSEADDLKRTLKGVRRKLDASAAEIARLRVELDLSAKQHRARVEELDGQLARVRMSLGWRLGAPVRWAKRRVAAARGVGLYGEVRLTRESGLFDPTWYLDTYPDVAESGIDPVEHYLLHGAAEGRDPGPGFCTRRYLEKYPDVGKSGMNPLLHFIRHGRSEGRLPL
ncbi:hypothetical protein [Novilysobacter spongiicola]|uniref:hypothetical protein n=1 Tax=Novilysobacter spongiicola TaxID=435289 RepID=UPI00117E1EF2|nr:hypothetical protein [Lysobacter spongiicola]